MPGFKMTADWLTADDSDPILSATTANVTIEANGVPLTKNVNGWTKEVENSIQVSAYPLAKWLAFNWWRIENEYLPMNGRTPNYDWRFAHELGAADNGYVWPNLLFVSDGDFINIWSGVMHTPLQSVDYIAETGLFPVPVADFQTSASSFISATIEKLDGIDDDLHDLWKIVQEERSVPTTCEIRRLEAILGYDPEECPEVLLEQMIQFQKKTGAASIKELAMFLKDDETLTQLLDKAKGIECAPQFLPDLDALGTSHGMLPWQLGVRLARESRKAYGLGDGAIESKTLLELLGIGPNGLTDYNRFSVETPFSVGRNGANGKWSFVPRHKARETSQRFELARFLGDALLYGKENDWLVTSDCKSSRQKMQRAFAAEFLCPISDLDDFLKGDYSETMQEKAAEHFKVSDHTIDSILRNNGRIERDDQFFPYSA